jgi:hypothetical protein
MGCDAMRVAAFRPAMHILSRRFFALPRDVASDFCYNPGC